MMKVFLFYFKESGDDGEGEYTIQSNAAFQYLTGEKGEQCSFNRN